MAMAAPLASASCPTCATPSGSTVQTAATLNYPVTSTDVTNGYAIISANWPVNFSGSYVVVGDYSYLKAAGTHNLGSKNCTIMGGITNVSASSVSIVVDFNPDAVTPVSMNDLIDVDFIGIGTVA